MFNIKSIVKGVVSVYNKPVMLEEAIEKAIKAHYLIAVGERIGVAISGGVDSMVLLAILKKLSMQMGFYLCALHYEHGIRKEESIRDMEFVENACKERKITLHIGQGDVPSMAVQLGKNLEATARMARYTFFEECKKKYNLHKIAIAHHRDDFAETFLLNLVRGSGTAGLIAMKYLREPGIIRPMLDISRKEIEAYALIHEIKHVEDSTNSDIEYSRNYIRKEIMPRLEKLNPETSLAIMRASELLGEEDFALGEYAQAEYRRVAKKQRGEILINIPKFVALNTALKRRVIREAISECGSLWDVEREAVDRVIALAESRKTGKYFVMPGKFFARVDYNTLIIGAKMYTIERSGAFPVREGVTDLWPGEFFSMELAERPEAYPEKGSMVQYIDADMLKEPVIRTRRPGDVFTPFGMTGTKKLQDWFVDSKIPRELRDGLPLLCSDKKVLWVIGYSLGEALRVMPETRRIYKIFYSYASKEE